MIDANLPTDRAYIIVNALTTYSILTKNYVNWVTLHTLLELGVRR